MLARRLTGFASWLAVVFLLFVALPRRPRRNAGG